VQLKVLTHCGVFVSRAAGSQPDKKQMTGGGNMSRGTTATIRITHSTLNEENGGRVESALRTGKMWLRSPWALEGRRGERPIPYIITEVYHLRKMEAC